MPKIWSTHRILFLAIHPNIKRLQLFLFLILANVKIKDGRALALWTTLQISWKCLQCVFMKWLRSTPCLTGNIILPANLRTQLVYREPIGEHFVQVCTTTPCMLRGSTEILNTVCEYLGGIKPGQTTKDGKFTVIEVECQGACSNAPMLVVGDDFYVSLSSISSPTNFSNYYRRI